MKRERRLESARWIDIESARGVGERSHRLGEGGVPEPARARGEKQLCRREERDECAFFVNALSFVLAADRGVN